MAFLSDRTGAEFTELARSLDVANNLLSGHLRRLEAAGLVRLDRGFLGRRPSTRVIVTPAGRASWADHVERLADPPG